MRFDSHGAQCLKTTSAIPPLIIHGVAKREQGQEQQAKTG